MSYATGLVTVVCLGLAIEMLPMYVWEMLPDMDIWVLCIVSYVIAAGVTRLALWLYNYATGNTDVS